MDTMMAYKKVRLKDRLMASSLASRTEPWMALMTALTMVCSSDQ